MTFIDSSVLLRYLTAAPEPHLARLKAKATMLFDSVEHGNLRITFSEVVLHETASVLTSRNLYAVPRADVVEYLSTFVSLPGVRLPRGERRLFLRAIELFGLHPKISMADALIVARAEKQQRPLATFDQAMDRLPYAESWQFSE